MKKIVWLGAVLFGGVSCGIEPEGKIKAEGQSETTIVRSEDSVKKKGDQTLEAIKDRVQSMGEKDDSLQLDTVSHLDTVKMRNP